MRRRLQLQSTKNTQPELRLRRVLHRRGLRFRVEYAVAGLPRRRVDIAFPRRKLAVMVDGCFWHGCPEHCITPKNNSAWWAAKIATNRARDQDTDMRLVALGWHVVRVWEHTSPESAADLVQHRWSKLG
ncbi:very short patch repair endonuclease [Janibacter terrae]|uniref:Very short patch repair endonuclease n=1 Tax=Janibacter terrae TaxID=103817 RepID=A0ABZ2FGL8_9MICO